MQDGILWRCDDDWHCGTGWHLSTLVTPSDTKSNAEWHYVGQPKL